MHKITKIPLHAKITKIPLHAKITKMPPTSLFYQNYPQNLQLLNCPQFRSRNYHNVRNYEITIMSEITKLPSESKITNMSLTT